eukprot:7289740-Alexandrium_andersonii.AAC.1
MGICEKLPGASQRTPRFRRRHAAGRRAPAQEQARSPTTHARLYPALSLSLPAGCADAAAPC